MADTLSSLNLESEKDSALNRYMIHFEAGVCISDGHLEVRGTRLAKYRTLGRNDKFTFTDTKFRSICSQKQLEEALNTVKSEGKKSKKVIWNRRAEQLKIKLYSGDIVQVAEVVRDTLGLYRDGTEAGQISYSEKNLGEEAVTLIAKELSFVGGINITDTIKHITSLASKRLGVLGEQVLPKGFDAKRLDTLSEEAIEELFVPKAKPKPKPKRLTEPHEPAPRVKESPEKLASGEGLKPEEDSKSENQGVSVSARTGFNPDDLNRPLKLPSQQRDLKRKSSNDDTQRVSEVRSTNKNLKETIPVADDGRKAKWAPYARTLVENMDQSSFSDQEKEIYNWINRIRNIERHYKDILIFHLLHKPRPTAEDILKEINRLAEAELMTLRNSYGIISQSKRGLISHINLLDESLREDALALIKSRAKASNKKKKKDGRTSKWAPYARKLVEGMDQSSFSDQEKAVFEWIEGIEDIKRHHKDLLILNLFGNPGLGGGAIADKINALAGEEILKPASIKSQLSRYRQQLKEKIDTLEEPIKSFALKFFREELRTSNLKNKKRGRKAIWAPHISILVEKHIKAEELEGFPKKLYDFIKASDLPEHSQNLLILHLLTPGKMSAAKIADEINKRANSMEGKREGIIKVNSFRQITYKIKTSLLDLVDEKSDFGRLVKKLCSQYATNNISATPGRSGGKKITKVKSSKPKGRKGSRIQPAFREKATPTTDASGSKTVISKKRDLINALLDALPNDIDRSAVIWGDTEEEKQNDLLLIKAIESFTEDKRVRRFLTIKLLYGQEKVFEIANDLGVENFEILVERFYEPKYSLDDTQNFVDFIYQEHRDLLGTLGYDGHGILGLHSKYIENVVSAERAFLDATDINSTRDIVALALIQTSLNPHKLIDWVALNVRMEQHRSQAFLIHREFDPAEIQKLAASQSDVIDALEPIAEANGIAFSNGRKAWTKTLGLG